MNESDCKTADWQLIGFEDGSYGRNPSHISQHRQECAEHGVTPDLRAYRQGHVEGSKNFCTKNNGFVQGRQGKNYNRNCPMQFEQAFLDGFADGQTLYASKKNLQLDTQNLENAYTKIDVIDRKIAKKTDLMIADGLNRQQRMAIRDEIEYHQYQLAELYNQLPELKFNFENSLQFYEQQSIAFANYL